jgi:hypothetical protein
MHIVDKVRNAIRKSTNLLICKLGTFMISINKERSNSAKKENINGSLLK